MLTTILNDPVLLAIIGIVLFQGPLKPILGRILDFLRPAGPLVPPAVPPAAGGLLSALELLAKLFGQHLTQAHAERLAVTPSPTPDAPPALADTQQMMRYELERLASAFAPPPPPATDRSKPATSPAPAT